MATRALDLKGLPEPVARGLEVVAEMARKLTGVKSAKAKRRKPIKFAVRNGKVLTPLMREAIYADCDE